MGSWTQICSRCVMTHDILNFGKILYLGFDLNVKCEDGKWGPLQSIRYILCLVFKSVEEFCALWVLRVILFISTSSVKIWPCFWSNYEESSQYCSDGPVFLKQSFHGINDAIKKMQLIYREPLRLNLINVQHNVGFICSYIRLHKCHCCHYHLSLSTLLLWCERRKICC